jgi:hypothetical protein
VLHRDDRLSQADSLPDAELDRRLDALTAGEEGAVGRAKVLKNETATLKPHLGMPARDLRVLQGDVADIASEDNGFLVE